MASLLITNHNLSSADAAAALRSRLKPFREAYDSCQRLILFYSGLFPGSVCYVSSLSPVLSQVSCSIGIFERRYVTSLHYFMLITRYP